MRLIIILFFSIIMYANELVDSVKNFSEQNIKINELNILLGEEKEEKTQNTIKFNSEINELKNKKIQILSIFPTLISNENINANVIKGIKEEKIDVNLKKAKENFYSCLSEIEKSFSTNNEVDNLKNIIDNYLIKITNVKSDIKETQIIIESYAEILTYLRHNTNVFASNYIFKQIDTNKFLSKVNSIFPKEINTYVNPGKIIICTLILLFVFIFKNLLIKLFFAIILKIFKKENNEHNLHLLANLTKPIGIFIYVHGIWLCCLIGFYPAPVMPLILRIVSIINIIIFTWLIITILNGYGILLVSKIARKSGKKEVINLMLKIAYFIIVIIAVLVILSKLGFDISTIIASLGIGGLAVALATKDIIANFFASVLLLFDNSFSQGDWVIVDGVEGTIVETGLRKTTIRTFDNCLVFIPNSKIMAENIKNWNRRKLGRIIKFTFGIEYGSTKEQIQNIIKDVKEMLQNHDGIAQPSIDNSLNTKDFKAKYKQSMVSVDDLDGYKNTLLVYLDEFADSSINITIYCFAKTIVGSEFLQVKEDVMLKVMDIVDKNKASFAFPSTSLYIEKIAEKN
ncbi:mechanosensitive ion channel family protein [Campylobacter sp. MG1]|uniref:mechanosensitive ion channel family protein n=1 Tax=Campylobacter sp. MG1 TaxID=2976332 RepID=UPI00226CBD7A|nr:mechanosensitive ion channel domain-containing protein [Campylobacter sp. MG1]